MQQRPRTKLIAVQTVKEFREAVNELLAMATRRTRHTIHEDDQVVFKLIWPMAAHAIEQIKAALVLIDNDMPYLAEANARVALEHALMVQWLMWTDDSERELVDKMLHMNAVTLRELQTAIDIPPEDRQAESSRPRTTLDFVQSMAKRFSPDGMLYAHYRRLSDAVHPSMRTTGVYLRFGADQVEGVFDHVTGPPALDMLQALALSLMACLSAVAGLQIDQTDFATLTELSGKWNLPLDWAADDTSQHLRRSSWPRRPPLT